MGTAFAIVGCIVAMRVLLNSGIRFLCLALIFLALAVFAWVTISTVVSVDYGDPIESHRHLTGSSLTPKGEEWKAKLGVGSSRELVQKLGYDRIPTAWGKSHKSAEITFLASSWAVLLLLALLLVDGSGHLRRTGGPSG